MSSRKSLWRGLGIFAGVVALAATNIAGANSVEEESANNLSVPAIFVPTVGVGTPSCTEGDDTVLPTPGQEDPTDGAFPGYWLQGEDTWQADCMTALDNTVSVTAEWGDNLQSAPLKQGTPVRVEVGLLAAAADYSMTGFPVVKLTPDELDRYATYGTNDGDGTTPYTEVRVWNDGAQLKIYRDVDNLKVYDGDFSAEINSTGKIVYGFNWQKPLPGQYTITFIAPTVTITGVDGGTVVDSHTIKIPVNVGDKAGGGGGKGGQGGGRPEDPGTGGGRPEGGGGGGGNGPGGPR